MSSTKILYLDCVGGIAGDMLLAALIDAGANRARLMSLPQRLGFSDIVIEEINARSYGFSSKRISIAFDSNAHPHHRHYRDICEIIDNASDLNENVKSRSKAVFKHLALAEAKVHGQTLETIHFHEVGAVDAIIDIIGCCELIDSLSIDQCLCSSLPLGHGTVECDHGTMPLPAPAVLAMLEGYAVHSVDIEGETITPTGMALLKEFCPPIKTPQIPKMNIQKSGIGSGTRENKNHPNIVRAMIGEAKNESAAQYARDQLMQLESDLDDIDPRLIPDLLSSLLEKGALDAQVLSSYMKKGRPGFLLRVLVNQNDTHSIIETLIKQSPTLGVRYYPVERYRVKREQQKIKTPWGTIEIKVAFDQDGHAFKAKAEYESALKLSKEKKVPLAQIIASAESQFLKKS